MENIKKFENSKFCYRRGGGGGQLLLPKKWLAHGSNKRYSLFEIMYEKFAICCIYDKISAGFYRVQILRKAYENVTFFSVGAVLASL